MLFCGVPRYFKASFNLSALLSSLCLCQASCSSPLVNPLQAVSPSYSTTFPALPHVSLYIQPHFSHNFHPLSCKERSTGTRGTNGQNTKWLIFVLNFLLSAGILSGSNFFGYFVQTISTWFEILSDFYYQHPPPPLFTGTTTYDHSLNFYFYDI